MLTIKTPTPLNRYSINLLLWEHNPDKHGRFPIYLKITINGKRKYSATGFNIAKKYWDEKNEQVRDSHDQADTINKEILIRKITAMRDAASANFNGETITAAKVKENLFSKSNSANFFDFGSTFSKEVENKRSTGTLENYKKHLLKLELYHGSKDLSFEEINHEYLVRYEQSLRTKLDGNYIHQLLKTIRSMFNEAIKRKITSVYPFATFEMPKYVAPDKENLTLDEISDFEKFADQTTNLVLKQTAVYFLLGCFTGLRISDWRQFDVNNHIKQGRVLLRAKKNGEWVSMNISKPLARNIKRIKLLALSIEEPTINEKLKLIAVALKITKHITSHTGRHTFAVTMCAERGVTCESCAELMGIDIKTCVDNYYRVSSRKIDLETEKAWRALK